MSVCECIALLAIMPSRTELIQQCLAPSLYARDSLSCVTAPILPLFLYPPEICDSIASKVGPNQCGGGGGGGGGEAAFLCTVQIIVFCAKRQIHVF